MQLLIPLYGGLSAVAWTDVIQVVFLVLGGLFTTYLALNTVSGGEGVFEGLKTVYNAVPERFEMILDESNPEYKNLPGLGVLVGGMWVNLIIGDSINILFNEL